MDRSLDDLKNKIIYRASYRGTKEMDLLMSKFVKLILKNLNLNQLNSLNYLVSLDDESLYKIKNKLIRNPKIDKYILDKFIDFKY
tara:strand:+ start:664 stop:918 length:255 start_codon:yes stop_codon:yes gene_type:complete